MTYFLFIAFRVVDMALTVLRYAIIASALLSWFLPPTNKVYAFLRMLTQPVVGPFSRLTRRFIRGGMPIDISPLLAYFAIALLQQLVYYAMRFI